MTSASYHGGAGARGGGAGSGSARPASEVSTTEDAMTIVSQLSQAKLPEATSHSWVTIMTAAATLAAGCGANSASGAASCAAWLPSTSARCSGSGRWWKNQLSGPGIGWDSWWKRRQVRSRQQVSPRSLIRPAPNSSRSSSQNSSQNRRTGGWLPEFPRKIARKPASSSSDSQPKLYQTWPTFTIDRYSAHSASQASMAPHSGIASPSPPATAAPSAAPDQATNAKNRSE